MGGQRRRKGRKVPGGGERPFVTQPEEASPGVGVGGGMSCDGRVQCDGRERGAGAAMRSRGQPGLDQGRLGSQGQRTSPWSKNMGDCNCICI